MDIKDVASQGGKARWKGKSKEERSKIMQKVASAKKNAKQVKK